MRGGGGGLDSHLGERGGGMDCHLGEEKKR